jgi:hypothetical protein
MVRSRGKLVTAFTEIGPANRPAAAPCGLLSCAPTQCLRLRGAGPRGVFRTDSRGLTRAMARHCSNTRVGLTAPLEPGCPCSASSSKGICRRMTDARVGRRRYTRLRPRAGTAVDHTRDPAVTVRKLLPVIRILRARLRLRRLRCTLTMRSTWIRKTRVRHKRRGTDAGCILSPRLPTISYPFVAYS